MRSLPQEGLKCFSLWLWVVISLSLPHSTNINVNAKIAEKVNEARKVKRILKNIGHF